MGFHFFLGVLDGLADEHMGDGLVLFHMQAGHQPGDALPAENAHQVVLQGEVEARGPIVSLAPGAPPQLIVDAAGLVAFGAHDEQSAQARHTLAQLDVGAPPSHVGGDGDPARLAGVGDDLRLLLVILGVEHGVFDLGFFEVAAQFFGGLDGHRPHQDGLTGFVDFRDVAHHVAGLGFAGFIDHIGLIVAYHGHVGGHHQHLHVVDLDEFFLFRFRRSGHPGQLFVHPEIVLEGDGGVSLAFLFDAHALFGLQRLV